MKKNQIMALVCIPIMSFNACGITTESTSNSAAILETFETAADNMEIIASTNTLIPTSTPIPTNTPVPTSTPIPTNTPVPTSTPIPTSTPSLTSTPIPISTPVPTAIIQPTVIIRPTEISNQITLKPTTVKLVKTLKQQKVLSDEAADKLILDVEFMSQLPDYPTGCESISTVMVLKYAGYDITANTFIDNYLPMISKPKYIAGSNIFDCYFVGNPRSEKGYLCFVNPLKQAVETYFENIGEQNVKLYDLTGTNFNDLFDELLNGNPVVIWATMGYVEPKYNQWSWGSCHAPSHTVVLVGYDNTKGTVLIYDPLEGKLELDYKKIKYLYEKVGKKSFVIKAVEEQSPISVTSTPTSMPTPTNTPTPTSTPTPTNTPIPTDTPTVPVTLRPITKRSVPPH